MLGTLNCCLGYKVFFFSILIIQVDWLIIYPIKYHLILVTNYPYLFCFAANEKATIKCIKCDICWILATGYLVTNHDLLWFGIFLQSLFLYWMESNTIIRSSFYLVHIVT